MATEQGKQLGLVAFLTNILKDFNWRIDGEGHIIIDGDAQTVANIFNGAGLKCEVKDGVIHFHDSDPK